MIFKNHKKYLRGADDKGGFTLIEIIVSLGIFSIVAVVALGALVKIIAANKKAQTLQSAMTNLNYALESMSRELRVGSVFYCTGNPHSAINDSDLTLAACELSTTNTGGTTGVSLAFRSTKIDPAHANDPEPCKLIYSYRLIDDGLDTDGTIKWKIQKAEQTSCNSPINDNDYSDITDPNLIVTGFYIKNIASVAYRYPMVAIRLSGYAGLKEKERTYFDIQTAVSARSPQI